jgi:hypothetical protein
MTIIDRDGIRCDLKLNCQIRIVRILVQKLETEKAAHLWLNTPNSDFQNRCPGDFFDPPWDLGMYVENHIF